MSEQIIEEKYKQVNWICLNNIYKYCKGIPDFETVPIDINYPGFPTAFCGVPKCKKNLSSCGNLISQSQMHESWVLRHPECKIKQITNTEKCQSAESEKQTKGIVEKPISARKIENDLIKNKMAEIENSLDF